MDEINWIRDRVCDALEVTEAHFNAVYDDNDKAQPYKNGQAVRRFISSDCPNGTKLQFYVKKRSNKKEQPMILIACLDDIPLESVEKDAFFLWKKTDHAIAMDDIDTQIGVVSVSADTLSSLLSEIQECAKVVVGDKRNQMMKFAGQIENTISEVTRDVHLRMPDVDLSDLQNVVDDYSIKDEIDGTLHDWITLVGDIIDKENTKVIADSSPMAVILFWRSRNALLSTLVEQLNTKQINRILKAAEHAELNTLSIFSQRQNELTKMYVEAKDNVKFLGILEKHFKSISASDLNVVLETLNPMMGQIHNVWIISRHFNSDEQMVPLMERIAGELANKVINAISLSKIFRIPAHTATETIKLGQSVLEEWKSTYMRFREKIEKSGNDRRWDFDRKRLFDLTDHIAKICIDLHDVTHTLDQFNKFLGRDLKAVTGESASVDKVMRRVTELVQPLESASFDVFKKTNREKWTRLISHFKDQVIDIESAIRSFLDVSFRELRSAEGAYNLLKKFEHIESRESINKQMQQKFDDILTQFLRELEGAWKYYDDNKDAPKIARNVPPIAGAIQWMDEIYQKQRVLAGRFQRDKKWDSAHGQEVRQRYVQFAQTIQDHKNELFDQWKESVRSTVTDTMKQSILGPRINDPEVPKGPNGMPLPPYFVNIDPSLKALIAESMYLDKMGYTIPADAVSITLRANEFDTFGIKLDMMLQQYHSLLDSLNSMEKELLKNKLNELQLVLKPGFDPLNWKSLHIPSFIDKCNRTLNTFQSMVSQIRKSTSLLDEVVKLIENTILVKDEDFPTDGLVEVGDFYEILETKRTERLSHLQDKYNNITPLIIKIEEVVAQSNSGSSPQLASFYRYWESKFFNAITKMTLSSMATLQALLGFPSLIPNPLAPGKLPKRPPLCKIAASFNASDIIMTPSISDMIKIFNTCVTHIVESSKAFNRWQNGSCLIAQPQRMGEAEGMEDQFEWTFHDDIKKNEYLIKLILALNSSIHRVFTTISKYLQYWKRYDKIYGLWDVKKHALLEKYVEKQPGLRFFAHKLSEYDKLAGIVQSQDVIKEIEFIRVDCRPIAKAIEDRAIEWKVDYGRILHKLGEQKLADVQTLLDDLSSGLDIDPTDLKTLKEVLGGVSRIKKMKMECELKISNLVECYDILKWHGVPDVGEYEVVGQMDQKLKTLIERAIAKDLELVDVKHRFTEVTKQDVTQFFEETKVMLRNFLDNGPGSGVELEIGADMVIEYQKKIKDSHKKRTELLDAEKLFNLPFTKYEALEKLQVELKRISVIFELFNEYREFAEMNSNMMWSELDITALKAGIDGMEKKLKKLDRELRLTSAYQSVEDRIMSFKDSVPLIQSLKNEAMKQRHWMKLMEVTKVTFEYNPKTLTLKRIFEMNLSRFVDEINGIVNEAMQELKIEKELRNVESAWQSTTFELGKYTKNGEMRSWLLRSAEDIKIELEDNLLNLQTISASRFVAPYLDQVRQWEKKLNHVSECIEIWFIVQTKWQYLEGIFVGSEDIRLQLPKEAKRFDAIDKNWKTIMNNTSKNPVVLDACHAENRLEMLQSMGEQLDSCQKGLSDYLDTKRNIFPRFFFISDDELLSVLGSSDPTSIQAHLLKLFDNCKTLHFGRSNTIVNGMTSAEGESYTMTENAAVKGPVEDWMNGVQAEMRASLRRICKAGVFKYAAMDRLVWIEEQLGMVTMLGSQIWWTWQVEDVFKKVLKGDKYAMKTFAETLTQQLSELVAKVRENLPKLIRKKINTLLIVDVHARDIVDTFVRDSILDAREFAWESQLRFYWDKDEDDVIIRQCTGDFRYGYEYMGLNGRLVITPLTDRCYMTLTQALTFKLGGSPAGPAGTGKTETVKDLAKNMALPCFVINCGEGLDYKAMGSIFSGLAQVGAWGCFDEFNRINIEVLSVVSAQLRAIQNTLNMGKTHVDIGLGTEIFVNPRVGVFITMNPGYAGRTELPDNLKALFRPVTMIVPDMLQICEIMLFSEGFEEAKVLAKKMTTLYKLASEQLSKQYHYDFGLRALKSVLVMAGSLKREFSGMNEELVLMRSLRDSNMPKFVFEDVPLFSGLINDLFPGLDCPRVAYPALKDAAAERLESLHMTPDDEDVANKQIDKVIQLYETMLTRHTTMVVGPTGGGKTVVLETLQSSSLTAFGKTIKIFTLNPKAQSVSELYGVMDPVTRDWTDGMLSKTFRDINLPLPPGKENEVRWIVYDGDIDAVWIENMNSVMDDNRLLTLPNGERIRLQDHAKMIMEVFDLQYASPATISRCGMTYVDPKDLGFRPYFLRWWRLRYDVEESNLQKQNEKAAVLALFEKYIKKTIEYVLEGVLSEDDIGEPLPKVVSFTNLNMVKQLCTLIDAVCDFQTEEIDHETLEGIFIFCLTWSVGATLKTSARPKFDDFVSRLSDISMPAGSLFDHFFDHNTRRWCHWNSIVPEYQAPVPFQFNKILVPTQDSVLYTYLLNNIMKVEKQCLFVGESGTAKTVTIQNHLDSLDPEKFFQLGINFSSRTTSMDVQKSIEENVDKRTGKIYGPPIGSKLIVFIDDLNMPKVDTYGTQQPVALLHFLVGRGCMYDRRKDLDLRIYKDLMFVGAMAPPGGGRNNVDPRFITLFNVFNLIEPNTEVLKHIYGSIVGAFFENFNDDVKGAVANVTDTTLRFFDNILEAFPPTPSKFHYIFNLRDLGRVYEGLTMATTDVVNTGAQAIRLWRNECLRIFADRLISDEEKEKMTSTLSSLVHETFASDADAINAEPSIYGDFRLAVDRLNEKEDPRIYEDLGNYDSIRNIFDEVLELYNIDFKAMDLVLFEMALEHLTRIHRIIRMPRGNALLVGVGGSGKQSLTKLATFCAGYKLFEIQLARNYGEQEFREDLKEMFKLLAEGPVVFLFTDAHVVEEGFLELINNLLTTGMVPALFEAEEKESFVSGVRDEVKETGKVPSSANCWNFFVNKCRDNLHLVLAMSPSGSALRRRCRNFPGLVSNCVIDWFFAWPEDALRKVAQFFLQDEKLAEEHRSPILDHMVMVHQNVVDSSVKFQQELRRHNYVTPKNYLDFIQNYRKQMTSTKKENESAVKRLAGGLTKLTEAGEAVERMSKELAEKKIIVDSKTKDCEVMINDISEKTEIANSQQIEAKEKQIELEDAAKVIESESGKANAALEEAIPALEAAASALEGLQSSDITEMKGFNNPPPLVFLVAQCVQALEPLGRSKGSGDWQSCQVMLGNREFMTSLINYNKDHIKDKQIKKVKRLIESDSNMNVAAMERVSKAGAGLLKWVVAIVNYHKVAKTVDPLKQRVADMEKQQASSEKELAAIQETLARLTAEIAELSANFETANSELIVLKEQATIMERRLNAANKLIAGLSSEKSRWAEDVDKLQITASKLVGDCLLSSSFLSYVGAFTFDYRQELIYNMWKGDLDTRSIPHSDDFKLEQQLASDALVQQWVSEGLPADEHSVMNGILTTRASRFPLCIDPQQQAVNWIKKKESKSNLTVRTFNDADFMKHLELAIQFGNPFLFENIDEELDPMIDPVLEKNTHMEGSQLMITLGDKTVEWDTNFRMYMTTKLANPHYSPEVMGKTMMINYSVTMQGLENQLLNVVVGFERPDLEEQFKQLVEEMSENTNLLVELEDSLLRDLASSQGNLLDNEDLIATLEEAKTKAVEISGKLDQANFTKKDINKIRSNYVPVAKRGSILFFAMSGMSKIMKMYEISLELFLGVFIGALQNSKRDAVVDSRIRNIVTELTRSTYDYTCTGTFERHKLMFSFEMTIMIMEGNGELNRSELDFFLKGDTSLGGASDKKPNNLSWLPDQGWKDLTKVTTVSECFGDLASNVKENHKEWKEWYDLESPESTDLPCGYDEKLNQFQRLLVIRCFRVDRVYNAVKLFVIYKMGEKFVQPPVLDYSRIYKQSNATTPVVFILSPGADPQSDIQQLAQESGFGGNKFKFLALGQGQAPVAEQLLETGATRGHWVLLQNCHLLLSWLKQLEKILQGMTKPHPDFRLWLTTDPTDKFPLGILQRSLKVVTEPPDGLKLNMRSSYSRISQDMLADCPHEAFRPLIYCLVFVHAVVLERRKYGKIGWNVNYDFNDSDFNISRRLLGLYLAKAFDNGDELIPWGSLKYLIGDAMYGGRVSDDFDRRVLKTYLNEYMGDFLFDTHQKFYFSKSGFDYSIPDFGDIENYTGMVETLPLVNSPSVFGLHPNAEIGYFTNASRALWRDLIDLQPRTAGASGGISREDYISTVAESVLSKIPEPTDVLALRKRFTQDGSAPSPTQIVLFQELERWNALVARMSQSLGNLKRALIGEIGMSDELEELGDSLFNGFLPSMWRSLAPNTEKPLGSWMTHFQDRFKQYTAWMEEGEQPVVWLSGFHIPESYLTALVQQTCRRKNWPLDKSTLFTEVTQFKSKTDIKEGLEEGCYVHGLYLEGAGWDIERSCLRRQDPKVLVVELPIMQIVPIESRKLRLQNTFRTPVYVTQSRRNAMGVGLVFEADLRSFEHESHWVLQGVALSLNTDQ